MRYICSSIYICLGWPNQKNKYLCFYLIIMYIDYGQPKGEVLRGCFNLFIIKLVENS